VNTKPEPPPPAGTSGPAPDPASFRDRGSQVWVGQQRVLRLLGQQALADWRRLSETPFVQQNLARGRVVQTRAVEDAVWRAWPGSQDWAGCVEHERIPFVSYPFEWSFQMLRDAALLHLELLEESLREGFILKDSSAYNVQWRGAEPVFIDVPSFIPLPPGGSWIAYHQFCRHFLIPLLLQAYRNIDFQPWLRSTLEGIDPEQAWRILSWRHLFRPGVFKDVFLHAHLQRSAERKGWEGGGDLRKALADSGFRREMILANVRRLTKVIERLRPTSAKHGWSAYYQQHSYVDTALGRKEQFVNDAAAAAAGRLVWDVGCNTGRFSEIAARHSGYVVSLDFDPRVIDRFYESLRATNTRNILPLIGDVTNPTPGMGWNLEERRPLWDRGKPDLMLCLALVHHIVISGNVPLARFIDWLAATTRSVVIEFVAKDDPMVKVLLRNKDDQYPEYERPSFEALLKRHFRIEREEALPGGTRFLYYAVKAA
jgi:SAM-dependent methyltransferase